MATLPGRLERDRCHFLVGTGPTGLALAAQLIAFGAECRIIDKGGDRVQNPGRWVRNCGPLRCGAVLAWLRSSCGVGTRPCGYACTPARGPCARSCSTSAWTTPPTFLHRPRVRVERRTELVGVHDTDGGLACRLRGPDGVTTAVEARYVVGATARTAPYGKSSGTGFTGGRYP